MIRREIMIEPLLISVEQLNWIQLREISTTTEALL